MVIHLDPWNDIVGVHWPGDRINHIAFEVYLLPTFVVNDFELCSPPDVILTSPPASHGTFYLISVAHAFPKVDGGVRFQAFTSADGALWSPADAGAVLTSPPADPGVVPLTSWTVPSSATTPERLSRFFWTSGLTGTDLAVNVPAAGSTKFFNLNSISFERRSTFTFTGGPICILWYPPSVVGAYTAQVAGPNYEAGVIHAAGTINFSSTTVKIVGSESEPFNVVGIRVINNRAWVLASRPEA